MEDAEFVHELLNEPAFLESVGDKGIQTIEDAANYIEREALQSYQNNGYGPYCMENISDGTAIGICSLKKRAQLAHPDLGFAILRRFRGHGYATEAALGLMDFATQSLAISTLAAITHPDNKASIRLLQKLGFEYQQDIHFQEFEPPTKLFIAQI